MLETPISAGQVGARQRSLPSQARLGRLLLVHLPLWTWVGWPSRSNFDAAGAAPPALSLRRLWRTLAVVWAYAALLSPPWWTPRAYLAYVLAPQPASQALSAGRPTTASAR